MHGIKVRWRWMVVSEVLAEEAFANNQRLDSSNCSKMETVCVKSSTSISPNDVAHGKPNALNRQSEAIKEHQSPSVDSSLVSMESPPPSLIRPNACAPLSAVPS